MGHSFKLTLEEKNYFLNKCLVPEKKLSGKMVNVITALERVVWSGLKEGRSRLIVVTGGNAVDVAKRLGRELKSEWTLLELD